jgi:competence ComEA-like helix-hairpin-helix protein
LTLLRRVTIDMTGLPPTPEEIQAFLRDKSPNAWEKVVDRLLASPAYGERWGRHWLIVAYLAKNFPVVKINVNKAAAKDLGTGLELTAKESEAIVQYRQAQGNFKTLDDLKKVPGLDGVKIESKKDRIEF